MPQKQPGDDGPSLELPSFGRRRRRRATSEEPAPTPAEEAPEPEPPRAVRPALGGLPAAVITGAIVGVLTVGLTWGALRLCEVVQGTSSCGNPGFFLLLAIVILVTLVGRLLLGSLRVGDPGSTSVLGVGLVVVVALLFLVDLLFEWWMILVVPGVAMATFALAHWVTVNFSEPADADRQHR